MERLRTTWTKLDSTVIKTYKPAGVDVTMAPASSLLWYRTTLVKRFGRWHLHEHNLFITEEFCTGSLTGTLPDPGSVQEVITLGHVRECTCEQVGFSVVEEALDLLGPWRGSSSSPSLPQPPIS